MSLLIAAVVALMVILVEQLPRVNRESAGPWLWIGIAVIVLLVALVLMLVPDRRREGP